MDERTQRMVRALLLTDCYEELIDAESKEIALCRLRPHGDVNVPAVDGEGRLTAIGVEQAVGTFVDLRRFHEALCRRNGIEHRHVGAARIEQEKRRSRCQGHAVKG
jgi:hypothetical protein